MKTSWWSCERVNLWWFNTSPVNSSGKLQLVRKAEVLVFECVRCYFILPAGEFTSLWSGFVSCGWLQKRSATSVFVYVHVCGMIKSKMKQSQRCRGRNLRSLTHTHTCAHTAQKLMDSMLSKIFSNSTRVTALHISSFFVHQSNKSSYHLFSISASPAVPVPLSICLLLSDQHMVWHNLKVIVEMFLSSPTRLSSSVCRL